VAAPGKGHKVYLYLLRELDIERPNQVWCADITYIPLAKAFANLVARMDWYSRKVLAGRLSNTMETDFCLDVLEEALAHYAAPGIFNTDQGSQFTSEEFTS
jgi:putative transposase